MKLFSLVATTCALLFALIPMASNALTCNGEVVKSATPPIANPGNDDFTVSPPVINTPNFGSHVYAMARMNSGPCTWHATKSARTGNYGGEPTAVTSDAFDATQSGEDNYGRTIELSSNVTAMQSQFGGGISLLARNLANGSAVGDVTLTDTLWFDKPGAADDEPTSIKVKLCLYYSSMWATDTIPPGNAAKATLNIADFAYNGPNSLDTLSVDTLITASETGTGGGELCSSGTINMVGPGDGVQVRLLLDLNGQNGYEYVEPNNSRITTKQGIATASFEITSLDGATCKSASGVFPGCGGKFNGAEKERDDTDCGAVVAAASSSATTFNSLNKTIGNPINFAEGFKVQKETDYAGGDLAFTRTYRSDADWFSNSVGQNWRHNFDRYLTFGNSPETQTVSIATGRGTIETFYKNYSGQWKPVDLDITAQFEETTDGYIYTRGGTSGTKEHFDLNGKLRRIAPRTGHALGFGYDGQGRLSTVTDEQGQSIALSYNGQDRVSSLGTSDGTFTYGYDAQGNLTSVTHPDGTSRSYHYEDARFPHALTGITDENGVRYATYAYNADGRAISSEHINGVDNYTVTYNPDDTATITNPLGKQTTYTFETIQGVRKVVGVEGHQSTNCAAGFKNYSYTPQGWLNTRTNWNGNVTDYHYDGEGLVTAITEDVGGADQRVTGITYIPGLRLVDTVTEQGRTTDYGYDAYGRVTSVAITDTNTGETHTTAYTYYPNTLNGNGDTVLGRIHTVNGPRTDVNDVTTYGYDSQNRLTSTTNALGHVTRITAYDAAIRPLMIVDPNGMATRLTYDAAGRLDTLTKAHGTPLAALYDFDYDKVGNLTGITLPGGTRITYSYDAARRLTGVEDALGNTITYTLDDAGNRRREDIRDASGVLKYTSGQVFDELSRLIEVVDANADVSTFSYDLEGNLTKTVDANANPTRFAYDGLNRLVSSTDALNGQTVLSINALDQTEGVTDPRSNETRYTYSAFGDVTQRVSPDTGTTTYTYDAAGNRTGQTDARGVVTNYTYDAINRLTATAYPSEPAQNVTLAYDAADCGASIGRLCTVEDAVGTASYVYDDLGRVTQAARLRDGLTFTTGYAYGADGHLQTLTLPSGRVVTYGRNANGQISNVTAQVNGAAQTLASNIVYLPFGPLEGFTYGNGLSLSASYDQDYEILNRAVSGMASEAYAHDPVGNITEKGDRSYTYDPLNRLDTEFNALTGDLAAYTLDAIGNRIAATFNGSTEAYDYPATSSRLEAVDGQTLSYDGAGNQTGDLSGARSLTYSAAGRLARVEVGGALVGTYTYDAQGQRAKKVTAAGTTYFVQAGHQLLGEYDGSGQPIREYVYLNGEPLAQIDAGEVLIYLHTDHLGTPRAATNVAGAQVWRWESDAYGNDAPTGTASVNLRFPGQYYDAETGLHYNWNRYYNPETGRYITSDPIGLNGGLNTYVYVEGNPVMFADPEGKETKRPSYKEQVKNLDERISQTLKLIEIACGGEFSVDRIDNLTAQALCMALKETLELYFQQKLKEWREGTDCGHPSETAIPSCMPLPGQQILQENGPLNSCKPEWLPGTPEDVIRDILLERDLSPEFQDRYKDILRRGAPRSFPEGDDPINNTKPENSFPGV